MGKRMSTGNMMTIRKNMILKSSMDQFKMFKKKRMIKLARRILKSILIRLNTCRMMIKIKLMIQININQRPFIRKLIIRMF